MEYLPSEILLKVLTHVTIKDLKNCAQVSKRFKYICNDEMLWQKINLCDKIVSTIFIEKILEKGCLYLNLNNAVLEGDSYFVSDSKLKYLDLSKTTADFGVLEDLVGSCKSLEKLSLAESTINSNILNRVCLNNGKTLSVLDLSGFQRLHDTIKILVDTCVNLTELNLSYFTKNLSKTIAQRNLWCPNLNNESVSYLVNNITNNIRKISFSNLKCVGDEHIKKLVKRCQNITELDLNYTNITNDSVDYIIQNLNESLVKLDVSNTKINSRKLIELKSMKKLDFLRCTNCDMIVGTSKLLAVLAENSESLHYEIAKPSNLNCQSPKEGLWNISVKQIELFDDIKKNTFEFEDLEDEFECGLNFANANFSE